MATEALDAIDYDNDGDLDLVVTGERRPLDPVQPVVATRGEAPGVGGEALERWRVGAVAGIGAMQQGQAEVRP